MYAFYLNCNLNRRSRRMAHLPICFLLKVIIGRLTVSAIYPRRWVYTLKRSNGERNSRYPMECGNQNAIVNAADPAETIGRWDLESKGNNWYR